MKVLISGFEAFGGETLNPTHLLIDELRAGRVAIPAGLVVASVLLPVRFANAFQALKTNIENFRPSVVMSLGQAGGREAVEIERVAVNMMDADIADNNGWQPREEKISPDGAAAFFSTLPVRRLDEALKFAGVPSRISNSAGLYVCNFLFYRLQEEASKLGVERSGFIHFPYLPEQAQPKLKPAMPLSEMKRALEVLLNALI